MHKRTGESVRTGECQTFYHGPFTKPSSEGGRGRDSISLGMLFWLFVLVASVIYGYCYREQGSATGVMMPKPLLVYVLCWGGLAFNARVFRWLCRFWWLTVGGMALLLLATGCAPKLSTSEQLASFCQAGPKLNKEKWQREASFPATGPYRLISGDLLEVHLPKLMQEAPAAKTAINESSVHICRVDESGAITLPLAGEVQAGGKTIKETEGLIEQAVYPRYFRHRPVIVVTVKSYCTHRVTLLGEVAQAGVYELPHNEMTLTAALSRAGGLTSNGIAGFRIRRSGENGEEVVQYIAYEETRGVPLASLRDGDIIEAEPAPPRRVTVLGLVQRPGVFTWKPNQTYNVTHALADAGGVDPIAAPEYVRIYRTGTDGGRVEVVVRMDDAGPVSPTAIPLKPDDVVCVEQTSMTQVRLFLNNVLHIAAGVDLRPGYH